MKKELFTKVASTRQAHNEQMHNIGRLFTWIALVLIMLVPVLYFIQAKTWPNWKVFVAALPGVVGAYFIVGFIEAISYAPLLGTGGQYLSFITGNVSNLKLPCAINAQNIAKTETGSEEQEIVTTISIAVSSIVTTLIIIVGLIPLSIFQSQIVDVLKPISPYIIPAIFGGLMIACMAKYAKVALIPFIICVIICVITEALNLGLGQTVMILVGMVVSGVFTAILYKKGKL